MVYFILSFVLCSCSIYKHFSCSTNTNVSKPLCVAYYEGLQYNITILSVHLTVVRNVVTVSRAGVNPDSAPNSDSNTSSRSSWSPVRSGRVYQLEMAMCQISRFQEAYSVYCL